MTPTLTLTRRGDFYEAHDGDAEIVARALGLVVTRSRDPEPVPMCGIPAMRLFDADYVPALLALGHVVTIDPGVVRMPKPVPRQGELP
jgi:DNA mismatch repair protein MutS